MALELKLKNTNTINAEGNRVYLEDITGVYDAVTNPGGYGVINPTREQTAILVLGLLKSSKGDLVTTFEPYNPLSAAKFNAIIGTDGWYAFKVITLPFYDELSLSDYNTGDILYDSTYSTVVKIVDTLDITDTESLLPAFIRTVEEIPLFELKDDNYTVQTIDTFFIANNSKVKLKINTQISNLIQDGADFTNKKLLRHKDNYNLVRSILQGSIYEFCRGNKYVAQKDIEFLNSNNYVLD